jgi:hypothetical protein
VSSVSGRDLRTSRRSRPPWQGRRRRCSIPSPPPPFPPGQPPPQPPPRPAFLPRPPSRRARPLPLSRAAHRWVLQRYQSATSTRHRPPSSSLRPRPCGRRGRSLQGVRRQPCARRRLSQRLWSPQDLRPHSGLRPPVHVHVVPARLLRQRIRLNLLHRRIRHQQRIRRNRHLQSIHNQPTVERTLETYSTP